jgi:hypothetical protein
MLKRLAVLGVALLLAAAPAVAQGKGPKKYKATNDRALLVTREVLVKQGYEVVAVEHRGPDIVVWYRLYDMQKGKVKGKGKGPKAKMVIRREADRVVFLQAPSAILVDIDLRLNF